ncbi:hypothetical protein JCM8097_005565 [Rhodosporidiobolus ruineniae]
MLSTTTLRTTTARRLLASPHPHFVSPLLSLQRTLATAAAEAKQLDQATVKDASHAAQPTRSFQPHFKDATPAAQQAAQQQVAEWKNSRPHENWVMHHPVYSEEELKVDIVHVDPKTAGDKVAYFLVWFARKGFDFVSGYKHASPEAAREAAAKAGKANLSVDELRKEGYIMSEKEWMARILFLESIAGVPGFTAGILRHLRSLRLMKRDGGWINSLLQEAENERMHLLTFMKIRDPSPFFRLLVLGAQGVFFNMFFLSYLVSPKSAHRFVGYLEEEACKTYTQLIGAIERGEVPEWDSRQANAKKVPQVAKDYWRLGDDATMLDLIKAVRQDEAGHRFTNHTLANLKWGEDFNPVALKHASPLTQGEKPGWTREESLAWAGKVQEELTGKKPVEGEKREQ